MATRKAIVINIETSYVVDKDFIPHNLSLNCSINGVGDLKITIDNNWKRVIDKKIIINNEWKQVIDTCVLINGNWECETGPFYYITTPFEMYGKEHKYYANYNPEIIFSKSGPSTLKMYTTSDSLALGYIFASFNAANIDGAKLRVNWKADVESSSISSLLAVYDGVYDRSNDEDFPIESAIPSKGAGLLQTLAYIVGDHVTITEEIIDVSSAQLDMVTIMIRIGDAWIGRYGYIEVSEFVFLNNKDEIIASVDKSGSFIQEVSGTYADYGTWGVNGG